MDRSNISNKMKSLETDSKLKFNVGMHGIEKDEVVDYNRVSSSMKTLIRRRLLDNDGSIEFIGEEKPAKNMESQTTKKSTNSNSNKKKPNDGSVASDSKNGDK